MPRCTCLLERVCYKNTSRSLKESLGQWGGGGGPGAGSVSLKE